jgi:hypothetical protein
MWISFWGAGQRITECQIDIEGKLHEVKRIYYEIGEKLSRAKEIVGHGNFQRWIEETWGNELPYSTAACYLAIYEKFKGSGDLIALLPLGLLQQMKQDSFPDVINQLILDNPEAFQKVDLVDFKQLFQDFKAGSVSLGEFERMAQKHIRIGLDIVQGQAHKRKSRTAQRIAGFGVGEIRKAISKVRKYISKMRGLFPPMEGSQRNDQVDAINEELQELQDDRLRREIVLCKKALDELLAAIDERQGLFRERLVEIDGIVKKEMVNNL